MFDGFYLWLHRKLSRSDEKGEYSAGVWQHAVRAEVVSLLKEAKGRFLEVGCGEGLLLVKLAKDNPSLDIHGIDIWENILERAKDKIKNENIGDIKLLQADATGLPFNDDFFDSAACINVLFNLPSEETVKKTLQEIARVVRTKGSVILDIRNKQNPFLYFKYKFAKYYDKTVKDLPLRTYSYNKISQLLDECGFLIEKKIEIGFPYNRFAPIFVIKAIRK
jgi:ubiquinone/menaquinone biosynthesis C-methylase UbiE